MSFNLPRVTSLASDDPGSIVAALLANRPFVTLYKGHLIDVRCLPTPNDDFYPITCHWILQPSTGHNGIALHTVRGAWWALCSEPTG
jgi:hypothetical protein